MAMLDNKKAEFLDLFQEFLNSYPSTEFGRIHTAHYSEESEAAQENLESIIHVSDRGEDVTEQVLTHLLPYAGTKPNQDMGYWISIAWVFNCDVRKKYEPAGWTKPEDWPMVAKAILKFVRRCYENPEDLASACTEFNASPYSKGFQAGTLTPILHALKPGDFILINNKSRRIFNYFAGTSYSQGLDDYPELNRVARSLVNELSKDIHQFAVPDIRDDDLIDMFSHWLVAEKHYNFDRANQIRIWWVNQGTTIDAEKEGGYLWAPTENKTGRSIYHWKTMLEVKEDDIILHYSDGNLRYVGQVLSPAEKFQNPHNTISGEDWVQDGHMIRVEYNELNPPVPLNKFSDKLTNLNIKQGPINSSGRVNQGYLFRLNPDALNIIIKSQPETNWPRFVQDMSPLSYWIFQANPQIYDVDGAVNELTEKTWLVNQYSNQIHAGNKVFIWESGKDGGILAVATVLTEPDYIPEDKEEEKFIKENDGRFEGDRLRVRLKIDHVLPEKLRRDVLAKHPVIGSTEIFRFANATNFKVTEEEARAINNLIFSIPPNPEYPLSQFAEETGFDITTLERWVRAIERKGQAILYGPPGTGKSFVAEHLARHLIGGGDGFWEVVQFHPAYAYEDFIQGIRPQSREDGGLDYPMVAGRFLQFCDKAKSQQGHCVLIIDEINRADLSKVLGELMYLLEYRNRNIPLAGGGSLHIPSNVLIIGTMNTADRSIALVDHALRRRFAFLPLYPDYDILEKYHRNTGYPVDGVIQTLRRLNNQIGDRHYEVGISYFLREDLETEIEDIWRMEIEPYLEEYFFDQPGKVDEFRWDVVGEIIRP